eukprot:2239874-Rhodomonas_salina.2
MPQYLLHVASQCAYVVPPLRAPVANSSTMHADRQHWKHVVLSSEFRVRLSQPKYPGTPSYVIASALVCLDCASKRRSDPDIRHRAAKKEQGEWSQKCATLTG